MTNVFVEAYNVLYTYLMGDSRKNELYIAKYIDFFLTQFEYKSVRATCVLCLTSMPSLYIVTSKIIVNGINVFISI